MKLKTAALLCAFLTMLGLHKAIAQGFTVSGQVTSQTAGTPLAGVTVSVKGTTTFTSTDVNGNYKITVPKPGSVLQVSYVGMVSSELTVNSGGTQNFSMVQGAGILDEVVVIGYGQQKKSLLTGAISSVKASQLNNISNTRIEQALQGRVSGVFVGPQSGQPGAGLSVKIRGTASNGNTSPIYVIDGIKSGGIESLDPSEIASIEILKDGASAAIYGSEGSNGVIMITTKSGNRNSSGFTYSAQYGKQSVKDNYIKMMNAPHYQQYLAEAGVANAPTPADVAAVGEGTDWINSVIQTAPQQHHSLSFHGGNDKATYYLGGNIFTQDGIVGGDKAKFNRYTVRINTDYKVKPWLNVGQRLSFSHHERKAISDNTEFGSILSSATVMDPLTPTIYTGSLPAHVQNAIAGGKPLRTDAAGNYYGISNFLKGEYGNPLARIDMAKGKNVQNKIFANVFADVEPIKGLKFTSRFGIDAAFQTGHGWTPTFWFSDESQNTIANGYDYSDTWFTWLLENFATYTKSIKGHNFTLLAGASQQKNHEVHIGGSYSGLFKEEDKFSYADFVPDAQDRIGSISYDVTLASLYSRLLYDYNGKYLFSASVRRDGSSRLPPSNRWRNFMAFSAGWIFTKENFFPQGMSKTISFGKLRGSWGQNGNLSTLGLSDYLNSIGAGLIYPDGNGGFIVGAYPTRLSNDELVWENGEQFDIGLDLGLLGNKLNFTVDYYKKTTKDLLTPGTPPFFVGNVLARVNAGNVVNKGWEFDLTYRNQPKRSSFSYEIGGNISFNKNEVTYLDPNSPVLNGAGIGTGWTATSTTVGEPIWYFNGYKTQGIFQTPQDIADYLLKTGITGYAPKPGDPIVTDVNGDKLISPGDMTKIGNPHPDFIYGAHVNVAYKGFDLTVFVQGQAGNDMLMGFNRTDRSTANKPDFFYTNRWTGAGSTNTWFAANTNNPYIYNSDLMIFDGSFMRVRQLQLGYTLPSKILDKAKAKTARIYVSLDDFFTFTKYPGVDPEVSNNGNSLGIDRGGYPIPRKAMVGITFTF
ncbi:MAG TPA: TonB-dependent receptor [Chitinophagaceae bacterium]|jgi:TonB-linked SusC/RagA family outer membrane protein|nr:TonB-dependent receptor [Chitinophagaceae bacterium]